MKAVRVHACGGPEALRYEEVGDPTAAARSGGRQGGVLGRELHRRPPARRALQAAGPPFTLGLGGRRASSRPSARVSPRCASATAWRTRWCRGPTRSTTSCRPTAWCRCPPASTSSRRGGHAAGHDGALPDHSTFPLKPGRHGAWCTRPAGGVGQLLVQLARKRAPASSAPPARDAKAAWRARRARTT